MKGRARGRWMLVVTFAAGMAWVEAACVYYLRLMVDRVIIPPLTPAIAVPDQLRDDQSSLRRA